MVIVTDKNYNAALNKAFLDGYRQGLAEGKREKILSSFTTNEIRELFGLDPIDGQEKNNYESSKKQI